MYETEIMDLQLFSEGGDGGAAGDAGEGGGSAAEIRIGDTLPDGTYVDENLASSMRENADMYRGLFNQAPAQAQGMRQAKNSQQAGEEEGGPTREEWNELKKKYGKFYGEDVHAAVNDRFKNQADATQKLTEQQQTLDRQQKLLETIMKDTGVSSIDELEEHVLNNALEAEAEEKDITVEQLRAMKELEAENQRMRLAEERRNNDAHINGLIQQAEELKQIYPGFDLLKEMENPKFRTATSPAVGMTVEEAYLAIHGKELQAQIMAYGVQTGKEQTAQAIQANARRPAEGANRGGRSGGTTTPNMDNMTDEQYEAIRNRTMQGEHVTL